MKIPVEDIDIDPTLEPMFLLLMLEVGDPGFPWDKETLAVYGEIVYKYRPHPPQSYKPARYFLTQYILWYAREQNRQREKTHS